MTDKEKLCALLTEFGIPYKEEMVDDLHTHYEITFGKSLYGDFEDSDKVEGYYGFFTQFDFDEDGKFQTVGAWE